LDGNCREHWQYFAVQPDVAVRPHVVVRPHVAAQPHVAAYPHVQDAEAGYDKRSDDRSETRLQSNVDSVVTWPEVPTLTVFEEADEEEEVVPETEESYQAYNNNQPTSVVT
jgi:hypothetical protein